MIRTSRALVAVGLAAVTVVPALAAAPAVDASPSKPAHVDCSPRAGTIFSSKAVKYARAWLPTSVSSGYQAGPGSIQYTVQKETSVTAQVSASFEVDEGFLFASAKETYGVSLAKSSSQSHSWTYDSQVPKGVTAKVQVFKLGAEVGIKQRYFKQYVSHCSVETEISPTGNFYPVKSDANDTYCRALVTTNHPKPQVRKLCTNKI